MENRQQNVPEPNTAEPIARDIWFDKKKVPVLLAVLTTMIASGVLLFWHFAAHPPALDNPISPLQIQKPQQEAAPTSPAQTPEPEVEVQPQILAQFVELYAQNPEMIGWIHIPGTRVDYPVMQSPYSDWDFYLNHNFNREPDSHGIPYIWPQHDPENDDFHFIFAHNMADGSQFADVAKYRNQAFFEAHPLIEFSTLYTERQFKIAYVFNVYSDIGIADYFHRIGQGYTDGPGFAYTHTTNWENQAEFDQFIELVREYQLYDTGTEIEFGERVIALWTCATGNPPELRLVVVAVER